MCGKELSDWDAEDDPFEIHYDKCSKTCAWAAARCSAAIDIDEDGNLLTTNATRLPTSKFMEQMRLVTFTQNKSWPHDTTRGHGANSKKMAKAGFIYTPQSPGDDNATCMYCLVSLNGWDYEDDPIEEHQKRRRKNTGRSCAFLELLSGPIKPTRSSAKPQSHTNTLNLDSDDEPSRVPSKTPASRRTTRGTGTNGKSSRSKSVVPSEVEDAEAEVGSEAELGKRVSKSKSRKGAKAKATIHVIQEEDEEGKRGGDEDDEVVLPKPKARRGRPPKNKKDDSDLEATIGTKTTTRKSSRIDVEPDDELEPEAGPSRKILARSRARAIVEADDDALPSSSKPSQSKTKSASKQKPKVNEGDVDDQLRTLRTDVMPGDRSRRTMKNDEDEVSRPIPVKKDVSKLLRTKSQRAMEEDTEAETDGRERPGVPDDRKIPVMQPKPLTMLAKGTPSLRGIKASDPRQSSSAIFDDAGHAIAITDPLGDLEAMDMDMDMHDVAVTVQSKKKSGVKGAHRAQASRENAMVSDGDVEMTDATAPPKSRRAPVKVKAEPHADSSRTAVPSRGSASNALKAQASARTSNAPDKMKVIEISSDSELEEVEDAIAPPIPQLAAMSNKKSLQPRPGSEPSKAEEASAATSKRPKMQMEVVIPVRPKKSSSVVPEGEDDDQAMTWVKQARETLPVPAPMKDEKASRLRPSTPSRSAPMHSNEILSKSEETTNTEVKATDELLYPSAFIPIMGTSPMRKLKSLSEEEASMTVEQYIRREMDIQYLQLKKDGERRLALIKEKAAGTRKAIETL
ncbi:BIR-domain-containing protein [Wolfiporia cocos MD-104 SS10]|uniref:BIR-domain-containing protein n=1 Tax=Wolfiporia cocos (strain MD-104) TaxID=742152 RepID=A0A2H3JSD9_WOLCO|nr:BIR-domain-containing protein [Wolfiporia cocos MD-104 SS10]